LKHLSLSTSEGRIAEEISRELGGHPLAISHVAGFIASAKCSLSSFLEKFQLRLSYSKRIWGQETNNVTFHYERTLETVWDIALAELSTEARDLIDILAFLSPESIPEELVEGNDSGDDIEWDFV
jgi:hypothetical protein